MVPVWNSSRKCLQRPKTPVSKKPGRRWHQRLDLSFRRPSWIYICPVINFHIHTFARSVPFSPLLSPAENSSSLSQSPDLGPVTACWYITPFPLAPHLRFAKICRWFRSCHLACPSAESHCTQEGMNFEHSYLSSPSQYFLYVLLVAFFCIFKTLLVWIHSETYGDDKWQLVNSTKTMMNGSEHCPKYWKHENLAYAKTLEPPFVNLQKTFFLSVRSSRSWLFLTLRVVYCSKIFNRSLRGWNGFKGRETWSRDI